jgi:hypothetical protein
MTDTVTAPKALDVSTKSHLHLFRWRPVPHRSPRRTFHRWWQPSRVDDGVTHRPERGFVGISWSSFQKAFPLIEATIVADSIGADAPRLTTFQLVYPRFIHAEVMTHRVFSRNASSSRAIPTKRMLAAIAAAEPAKPVDWRMNESGMQGFTTASRGCRGRGRGDLERGDARGRRIRPQARRDRRPQAIRQPADRAVPAHPRGPDRDRSRQLLRLRDHPTPSRTSRFSRADEGGDGRQHAKAL